MRLNKIVLVLGVAALMVVPAFAQPGGGRGGFGGFGGRGGAMSTSQLLQNKSVQEELKIDKDQLTKIDDAVKKVREDMKDDLAKMRERGTKPEERAEITKKLNEANTKALAGILTKTQEKRLNEIRYQVMGLAIFTDEEAAKTLKITDDQKEKIKEIRDNAQKDTREVFGDKPDFSKMEENMKKIQSINKEALASATKTLTAAQKTQLKEMTGEPFEIKMEFGGRGGKPGDKPGKPGDKPRDF